MSNYINTLSRYNLRSNKIIEDDNKISSDSENSDNTYVITSDEDSYEISIDESDNDNDNDNDSFIASSDDDEDEKMDMSEYYKFLSKIFPSKHINEKILNHKKMTDTLKKSSNHTSEQSVDIEDETSNKDGYHGNKNNVKKQPKDNMNFNILFTIGNNNGKNNKMLKTILNENYEDDDITDSEDDEDDEYDEYDEDDEDEDEDVENSDKHDEGEKMEKNNRLNNSINKLFTHLLETDLSCGKDNYNILIGSITSYIEQYAIYDTHHECGNLKKKRKVDIVPLSKSHNSIKTDDIYSILTTFDIEKQTLIKGIIYDCLEKYKTINDEHTNNISDQLYRVKCLEFLDNFNKYIQTQIKKYDLLVKKRQLDNTKTFREKFREGKNANDLEYFKGLPLEKQKELIDKMDEIEKYNTTEKPYRITLIESDIPTQYKAHAMRKINALSNIEPGGNEYYKIKKWVDGFMKIPFGKYNKMPISIVDGIEKCNDFMLNAKNILDDAVYGMNDAKKQILQMMGQIISNPTSIGSAIAINGPMGTGKTTLVKEGVSKILNRPFAFIPLGGATDSSYLEGHSYTYEGSIWGQIIDIVMNCGCMNPVIYFDELDKISDSAKGEEIVGILTHLTDTTQNNQFQDKYFSGIDFDLSKVLFIFSYNDEKNVNKILLDRMYRIKTNGYNKKEKIKIARDYLIPNIERNINFKNGDINIIDDALNYINENLTQKEDGVRNLKRCIEILYTKLNLYRLMKKGVSLFEDEKLNFEVSFPFIVTKDIAKEMIKDTMKKDGPPEHLYC